MSLPPVLRDAPTARLRNAVLEEIVCYYEPERIHTQVRVPTDADAPCTIVVGERLAWIEMPDDPQPEALVIRDRDDVFADASWRPREIRAGEVFYVHERARTCAPPCDEGPPPPDGVRSVAAVTGLHYLVDDLPWPAVFEAEHLDRADERILKFAEAEGVPNLHELYEAAAPRHRRRV